MNIILGLRRKEGLGFFLLGDDLALYSRVGIGHSATLDKDEERWDQI